MKDLIKKWWFWIISLLIIIIIGFITIVMIGFNVIRGEIGDFETEIQKIYQNASVYSSLKNNALMIEIHKYKAKEDSEQLRSIKNKVKEYINSGKLSRYNKLIIVSYMNTGDEIENMITKEEYSLPSFDAENLKAYIDFDEYSSTVNNLIKAGDSLLYDN